MFSLRVTLLIIAATYCTNVTAQDTTFVAEIKSNFSNNLPKLLAIRGDNNPAILTGPSANGSKNFNTTLILLPDAYQTIDFSDVNAVRYESYLPYKSKASRDALHSFVMQLLKAQLDTRSYSVETRRLEGENKTTWLLRQNSGGKAIESQVIMFESHKQLGTEMYYLLTINIANKQQNYKLRAGIDSLKVRLVQPAELIRTLAGQLPNGLKALSMFTYTKDSTEFYPFIQMPQFASQPNSSHLINNYASWYAGQVRYEANRYFPDSKQEGLDFLQTMLALISPVFSKPPEVLKYMDNESIAYVWSDMSMPYLIRLEYKAESGNFPRQVNFNFKSSPDERNRFAISADLKAAEEGNARAMNEVGVAYYNGKLVPRDYVKAADYFRRAAEAGDRIAMTNYGMVKLDGTGTKKNIKEGLIWYEKATAGNFPFGLYKLAYLCRAGVVMKKDVARAISLLKIAADSNYMPAIKELGSIYDDEPGFEDDAVAASYFYISSANGDGYSTAMIGYMHEMKEAKDSAFRYYDKAATQDYPHAYAFIGDYRRKLREFDKAWDAYQKGASLNNAYCMNRIAIIYQYGQGAIAADRKKAKAWYKRAADAGSEPARESYDAMEKEDNQSYYNGDDD